jgi:3-oxoacyl-[acyl-carrier-protein] synthase II
LGACGGLEAIIMSLSMQNGVIPPTLNLHDQDPECDLNYVPCEPKSFLIRNALSVNSGFGGKNAAVIFSSVGRK